jgi:hypothetical protein
MESLAKLVIDDKTPSTIKCSIFEFASELIYKDNLNNKSSSSSSLLFSPSLSSSSSTSSSYSSNLSTNGCLTCVKPLLLTPNLIRKDFKQGAKLLVVGSGFFTMAVEIYGNEVIEKLIQESAIEKKVSKEESI